MAIGSGIGGDDLADDNDALLGLKLQTPNIEEVELLKEHFKNNVKFGANDQLLTELAERGTLNEGDVAEIVAAQVANYKQSETKAEKFVPTGNPDAMFEKLAKAYGASKEEMLLRWVPANTGDEHDISTPEGFEAAQRDLYAKLNKGGMINVPQGFGEYTAAFDKASGYAGQRAQMAAMAGVGAGDDYVAAARANHLPIFGQTSIGNIRGVNLSYLGLMTTNMHIAGMSIKAKEQAKKQFDAVMERHSLEWLSQGPASDFAYRNSGLSALNNAWSGSIITNPTMSREESLRGRAELDYYKSQGYGDMPIGQARALAELNASLAMSYVDFAGMVYCVASFGPSLIAKYTEATAGQVITNLTLGSAQGGYSYLGGTKPEDFSWGGLLSGMAFGAAINYAGMPLSNAYSSPIKRSLMGTAYGFGADFTVQMLQNNFDLNKWKPEQTMGAGLMQGIATGLSTYWQNPKYYAQPMSGALADSMAGWTVMAPGVLNGFIWSDRY